jgi:DtxR family transcriptional regulator, Mn-dependent transcriptional regulator
MRSVAEENYLKETYALQLEHNQVTTSMLADRIGHAAPTVTGMLKKLASRKLVSYEPYQGVTLTKSGRAAALEVIRHHRLLETYLTRALGVPWDRVHEEAEKLEHVLSEYLEGLIDEYLGHPASDPHGSPIPSPDLSIKEPDRLRLSDLPAGSWAQVVEVGDHEPALLARLGEMHLGLETRLQVLEVESIDGLITILVAGKKHILGQTAASQIIVRRFKGERDA